MKRTRISVGDIFEVTVDRKRKKYFQFIAKDSSALGSDVIRVFDPIFELEESPNLSVLAESKANTFLHVFLRVGLRLGVWRKVGHSKECGNLDVYFRNTNDWSLGVREGAGRVSETWWVWRINEEHKYVGRLSGKYRDSHPGIVFPPDDVLEILKGRKAPPTYPDFE